MRWLPVLLLVLGCDKGKAPEPCTDEDLDGICDFDDVCAGPDASGDTDGDRVCDAADPCPLDAPDDSDGDGTCDSEELCPGGDDSVDTDRDKIPDACDPCPEDAPDDSDGDGVCNSDDACEGDDAMGDSNEDGICDNILFVDAAASGANDGSSWEDAFTTVQAASDAALVDDEVWIAAGDYPPTFVGDAVLRARAGVVYLGGFDGTESSRQDRAGLFDETVLTGDFGGNDDGTTTTTPDNSPVVVRAADGVVFDGFTIAGGAGGGAGVPGSALTIASVDATLRNLIVRDNVAPTTDGTVYIDAATVTIDDCLFADNQTAEGGAVRVVTTAAVTVRNSTFTGNTASNGGGAALCATGSSNVTVVFSSFDDNTSTSGAVSLGTSSATLTVRNSVLWQTTGSALVDDGGFSLIAEYNASSDDLSALSITHIELDGSTPELSDPFVDGAGGERFLAQTAAGQAATSAAVNAGDATEIATENPNWGQRTTRTDGGLDVTVPDMGAHYLP